MIPDMRVRVPKTPQSANDGAQRWAGMRTTANHSGEEFFMYYDSFETAKLIITQSGLNMEWISELLSLRNNIFVELEGQIGSTMVQLRGC